MGNIYQSIGEAQGEYLALVNQGIPAWISWMGSGYEVHSIHSAPPQSQPLSLAEELERDGFAEIAALLRQRADITRCIAKQRQIPIEQQQAWDADDALLAAVEDAVRCDRFELKRQAHGGFAIMGDSGYYQSIQHRLVAEMLHAFLAGDITASLQLRTQFIESLPVKP